MEVPGKRSAGDKDKSAENVDIVCKPCQRENVTTPANGFCKDCDEFMCTICFRQHLKGKLCRHHVLVNVDLSSLSFLGSVERPVSCKQHDGETVKFYCHTHEVVGCGDCIIIKHKTCQPEYIRNLSDNFHQHKEYKSLKENIEKVISERKCFEKDIQDNKMYNKIMLEKAVGKIRQIKLDINEYLDKVESDVVAKIEKIMKENETLLIKIEDECKTLSIKLEKITEMLNSKVYQDNALFIHAVECKPKVSECVMALLDMKSKMMKKYEFVPDQQLLSLSTTDENLGTVAISTMNVCQQTTERAKAEGGTEDSVEMIPERTDVSEEDTPKPGRDDNTNKNEPGGTEDSVEILKEADVLDEDTANQDQDGNAHKKIPESEDNGHVPTVPPRPPRTKSKREQQITVSNKENEIKGQDKKEDSKRWSPYPTPKQKQTKNNLDINLESQERGGTKDIVEMIPEKTDVSAEETPKSDCDDKTNKNVSGQGVTTDRILIKNVGTNNDVSAAAEKLRTKTGERQSEIFCVQNACKNLDVSTAPPNLQNDVAVKSKGSGPSLRNRDMRQDKKGLELYVEMHNIPVSETTTSLKKKLFDLHLQIVCPTLVYCDGYDTAILICHSEKDAVYLSKYRETHFKFRRIQKKCLSSKLDARVWNIAKESTHFNVFSAKLKEIQVTVIDKDIPEIMADTTYQIKCARAMLAQFDTKKHTKVLKEQESKNGDSFALYEKEAVLENVSFYVWSIVSEQAQDDIRLFEKDFGKFRYSPKQMTLTIPAYKGHTAGAVVEKVKNGIEMFKSKEILEIPLDIKLRLKDKIRDRCKDVEEAVGYPCLQLVNEGRKVLAFAESYDQLLAIKHQVLLKFEITKPTARSRATRAYTDNHGNGSSTSTIISAQISDNVSERGDKKKLTLRDYERIEKYKLHNIDVYVYQADILKVQVDCIVNAANKNLSHGGGVAAVIARAAGKRLTEEGDRFISENGQLQVGRACTTTAGDLPYKGVIHTVGPQWTDYSPHSEKDIQRLEKDLYQAIFSCFLEAENNQMKTIAIPAVSSAIFGVPAEICVNQYANATIEYCKKALDSPGALSEIHFIDMKLSIVKKVQDIFNIMVRDGKPSPYNRNVYVQKTSMRAFNQEGSTEADALKSKLPEPLYYEEGWRHSVFCAQLGCTVQIIYKQDIFMEEASAIVIPVNKEGKGGGLCQSALPRMPVGYAQIVNTELNKRLRNDAKVGQVEVIDGYSCGYPLILFVVYPHSKSKAQRNVGLEHAYLNVLMSANKTPRIKSVVTTLFGIDQKMDEELQLGAEAFLSSFISCCERLNNEQAHLDVKIICNTENGHDVVSSVFKRYVLLHKSEGNVDSKENTSDEKQVWLSRSNIS